MSSSSCSLSSSSVLCQMLLLSMFVVLSVFNLVVCITSTCRDLQISLPRYSVDVIYFSLPVCMKSCLIIGAPFFMCGNGASLHEGKINQAHTAFKRVFGNHVVPSKVSCFSHCMLVSIFTIKVFFYSEPVR